MRRYDGPERRYWHRHRLTCLKLIYRRPLLWRFVKSVPSRPAHVSNITSRGVRFYADVKLKPGTLIDVSFDVPEGVYRISEANRLRARVIWQRWSETRRAYRTGVKFIHVLPSTHTDVTRMIKDAALHSARF